MKQVVLIISAVLVVLATASTVATAEDDLDLYVTEMIDTSSEELSESQVNSQSNCEQAPRCRPWPRPPRPRPPRPRPTWRPPRPRPTWPATTSTTPTPETTISTTSTTPMPTPPEPTSPTTPTPETPAPTTPTPVTPVPTTQDPSTPTPVVPTPTTPMPTPPQPTSPTTPTPETPAPTTPDPSTPTPVAPTPTTPMPTPPEPTSPTTPTPETPAPTTPTTTTPPPPEPTTPTPATPKPTPPVQDPVCGRRNFNGIAHRIVVSSETEYGEFPWMMAVFKQEADMVQDDFVFRCGGSLIHPRVVLTGAHCIHNRSPAQLKVRGGEWDTQSEKEMYGQQDRNVAEIIVHPDFYRGGLHNDVALLIMDTPFELNQVVQPVCLPPQDTKFDHQWCYVSGWGKSRFGNNGTMQTVLKKVDLPIVPSDQCQTSLRSTRLGPRFVLHNSFICAGGEKDKDSCTGDGGSPLVCSIPGTNEHYYQVGLVAWGIGCGEKQIPGVYADIAHFRGWIDEQMQARQIDTGSYTP